MLLATRVVLQRGGSSQTDRLTDCTDFMGNKWAPPKIFGVCLCHKFSNEKLAPTKITVKMTPIQYKERTIC